MRRNDNPRPPLKAAAFLIPRVPILIRNSTVPLHVLRHRDDEDDENGDAERQRSGGGFGGASIVLSSNPLARRGASISAVRL